MVTAEQLRHFVARMDEGGAAYRGTRDAALRPAVCKAYAVALGDDAGTLQVYVPAAAAARTVDNLRDNGQAALVICRVADFRTYQVKGVVARVREARADERELVARQHAAFARSADDDLTGHVVRAFTSWPALVAEVAARDVYLQTPGPGAGRRVT
jgi:hypothetical protein